MDDFKKCLSNKDDNQANRLPIDPLRLAQCFESQFGRSTLLYIVAHHVPSADFIPGEAHKQLTGSIDVVLKEPHPAAFQERRGDQPLHSLYPHMRMTSAFLNGLE